MAQASVRPIANVQLGREKLEQHLPLVLGDQSLEQRGWTRLNAVTLVVPVHAGLDGADDFFLRLGFEYYGEWPPTACFVNPVTLSFAPDGDLYWLPVMIGDPGFAVHAKHAYENQTNQLICCSFTADFYLILHSVQPEHIWDCKRYNFGATIHRVERALRSEFYKGRAAPNKPQVVPS